MNTVGRSLIGLGTGFIVACVGVGILSVCVPAGIILLIGGVGVMATSVNCLLEWSC